MDIFNKFNVKPMQVLKVAGIALLGVLVLAFALQLIGTSFRTLTGLPGQGGAGLSVIPGMATGEYAHEESASYAMDGDMAYGEAQLSARNVAAIYPAPPGGTTGDDAEAFEVTDYRARVETRHLSDTCGTVADLKVREDVIFESANEYDRGCNYSFKVKHESVEEVLAFIESLEPEELSENTYTIKNRIEDFTSEEEVLRNKRASIDETLESALDAYDEITALATRTQNADALARIIASRVDIIERLTQERININEQLDRLARAKAEQLDRLEYTYFYVDVRENKYVDGDSLKESWKAALKDFVRQLNDTVQDLTIGLVLLAVFIVQYALYALLLLLVVKYGWKLAKHIWNS
jgi:hypothetical protein